MSPLPCTHTRPKLPRLARIASSPSSTTIVLHPSRRSPVATESATVPPPITAISASCRGFMHDLLGMRAGGQFSQRQGFERKTDVITSDRVAALAGFLGDDAVDRAAAYPPLANAHAT